MKKMIVMILLTLPVLCNAMLLRIAMRQGYRAALGACTTSAVGGLWYNQKRRLDAKPLNTLDKEVVVQFYEKNPDAKKEGYQQLKREAVAEKSYWFDVLSYTTLYSRGKLENNTMLINSSNNTECEFTYDLNPITGKHCLSEYRCRTCLTRGEIKKYIRCGIQEGRIEE